MSFTPRSPQIENQKKTGQYEQFAQAGFAYLVADPKELARFMSATGYDANRLRCEIGSVELDMALMDYFAANEPALLAMCSNMKLDVTRFMACWQRINHSM